MVINTNLNSATGALPVKPNNRTVAQAKASAAADTLSAINSADSQLGGITGDSSLDIQDGASAGNLMQLLSAGFANQPGQMMSAQANFSPESVLRLLQD